MQWFRGPNQSNVNNLTTVRHEDSRLFRNKMKEYTKDKIVELETKSKMENIRYSHRDISNFKKGYQPRINIAPDEKGDWFRFSHSLLARCRNHFSQLFSTGSSKKMDGI